MGVHTKQTLTHAYNIKNKIHNLWLLECVFLREKSETKFNEADWSSTKCETHQSEIEYKNKAKKKKKNIEPYAKIRLLV